jgi:hypothetical protein
MIRYGNRDIIGRVGGPLGGICVGVAARGLAGPGCGGRWVTAVPVVGLGVGPVVLWPAVREGRA